MINKNYYSSILIQFDLNKIKKQTINIFWWFWWRNNTKYKYHHKSIFFCVQTQDTKIQEK